jgi:biopolymer transport protein ExbD
VRIEVPRRRRAGVRLTPLIDVVFILLVFFMLASSFLDWRGFDLSLPPADAAPDPALAPIVVAVDVDGQLRVGGAELPADRLAERIRALRDVAPERPVVVQPAARAPVQATVDVLDRLRAAEVAAVSLAEAAP